MKVNPRTFVAACGAANLEEVVRGLAIHPGLHRRNARQLAERWACRLGLLRRWQQEKRRAAEEAARKAKDERQRAKAAVAEAAKIASRFFPSASGMVEIASAFLMPEEPERVAPKEPKLSRRERRDLQFGRAKSEQS